MHIGFTEPVILSIELWQDNPEICKQMCNEEYSEKEFEQRYLVQEGSLDVESEFDSLKDLRNRLVFDKVQKEKQLRCGGGKQCVDQHRCDSKDIDEENFLRVVTKYHVLRDDECSVSVESCVCVDKRISDEQQR